MLLIHPCLHYTGLYPVEVLSMMYRLSTLFIRLYFPLQHKLSFYMPLLYSHPTLHLPPCFHSHCGNEFTSPGREDESGIVTNNSCCQSLIKEDQEYVRELKGTHSMLYVELTLFRDSVVSPFLTLFPQRLDAVYTIENNNLLCF